MADKVEAPCCPLTSRTPSFTPGHEPLGVVACITPWNCRCFCCPGRSWPQLWRQAVVVIKPSEFTSASTLEFAKLAKEAGFPDGVINTVTGFEARDRRRAGRACQGREGRLHRRGCDGCLRLCRRCQGAKARVARTRRGQITEYHFLRRKISML